MVAIHNIKNVPPFGSQTLPKPCLMAENAPSHQKVSGNRHPQVDLETKLFSSPLEWSPEAPNCPQVGFGLLQLSVYAFPSLPLGPSIAHKNRAFPFDFPPFYTKMVASKKDDAHGKVSKSDIPFTIRTSLEGLGRQSSFEETCCQLP